MKTITGILVLLTILIAGNAFASFAAKNASGTSLGAFAYINCSTGVTCTKDNKYLKIVHNPVGTLMTQVASTTVAITASQCGSTFVSNSADVMTLPEASTVLGCRLTFISGTADDFDINPADGTDIISSITASGATINPSAGDAIRITDIGSSVTLEAIGNDRWAAVAHNGPITDVN